MLLRYVPRLSCNSGYYRVFESPFKALKSLALLRNDQIDEALALCDEVVATKPTDEDTLSALYHVLRTLDRRSYERRFCAITLD